MAAMDTAALLDALFLPLASGAIRLPGDHGALFLRARAGAWLHAWPRASFACEQGFKPFADELAEYSVCATEPASGQSFSLVFVLPPRQREEARALLARAVRQATPGGIVIACQSNNEGARSGQSDLERLAGPLQSLSKHKCRVYWTSPLGDEIDRALLDDWAALDAPRPIADGRYLSRPGLFAWDRIDAASALLAQHLPSTLAGRAADLGAGYGYLACELLSRCPGITAVDLYEAEQRALEPARINLDKTVHGIAREVAIDVIWHDVTRGLPRRYDTIVSNPPFHQGRADQPELGQAFINTAANALTDAGVLWLVANRHLPYETLLGARFNATRKVVEKDGFKVIEAKGVRR
jgi:16S rRNA (guanine1207-N2)-methyltransferase